MKTHHRRHILLIVASITFVVTALSYAYLKYHIQTLYNTSAQGTIKETPEQKNILPL